MSKSKGMRKRTRNKLKKSVRERGKVPVTRFLKEFKEGDKVLITPEPSVQKAIPHPRFFNKHGEVVGKRGNAYLVKIRDKKAEKIIITRPVHLRKVVVGK